MALLSEVVKATKKMQLLLLFVALLYVGSYLTGWYLISIKSPVAVETVEATSGSVLKETPFTAMIESLQGGQLVQAIPITFLLNLTSGAFLTTTLPWIIPIIGALGVITITWMRGLIIGLVYPEILISSIAGFALGVGTMILELGAYVFSGAAGIHIALAPIMSSRYGVQSRRASFKIAWRDAARVYVVIVILLVLGAIWEMTGILLLLRPT